MSKEALRIDVFVSSVFASFVYQDRNDFFASYAVQKRRRQAPTSLSILTPDF